MTDINELILDQTDNLNKIRNSFKTYLSKKNFSIGVIESRLILLDKYWDQYQNTDNEIQELKTNENKKFQYFTDENFRLDAVEELYADVRGEYFEAKHKIELKENADSHSSSKSSDLSVTTHHERKLPPLPIPTFDGDIRQWLRFQNLFNDMIVKSNRTDAEKLSYLLSALSGEPLALIKTSNVSDGKFETDIWNKLVNYKNNKRIINAYVDSLLNLKPLQTESAAGIQRLISEVTNNVESLKSMGAPIKHWDYLLVPIIINKVDSETRRHWEDKTSDSTEPATYEELSTFLKHRLTALTAVETNHQSSKSQQKNSGRRFPISVQTANVNSKNSTNNFKCFICNDNHYISYCNKFKASNPTERLETVRKLNSCYNCLGKHLLRDCKSSKVCQTCKSRHHTLLHEAMSSPAQSHGNSGLSAHNIIISSDDASGTPASVNTASLTSLHISQKSLSLLGTAMVEVESNGYGSSIQARALIDSCSTASLIAESLVQRLNLPRRPCKVPVTGVGSIETCTKGVTQIKITSRLDCNISYTVEALILGQVSSYEPRSSSCLSEWTHISQLPLADPQFSSKIPVELIIGMELYTSVLLPGLVKGADDEPIAQLTTFGWILMGSYSKSVSDYNVNNSYSTNVTSSSNDKLNEILQKFWEIESVPYAINHIILSKDEQDCEAHFQSTYSRDESGRFIVRLPFKSSNLEFPGSLEIAKRAFSKLESRLSNNQTLNNSYFTFIDEYHYLKHLSIISNLSTFISDNKTFFIPHHGIIQHSDKFRSVFNGSMRCYNSVSLNEMLHTGPSLQSNIVFIIIRWRMLKYVYTADIAKMYRQVLIHPDDRKFQRILWRFKLTDDISICELNTVTYGLGPSAYQAIRCLRQLASDEASRYPDVVNILLENMYVDDCLFGADSKDEAISLSNQLTDLLMAGGFPLRKWLSNDSDLLEHIPIDWLQSVTDDSQLLCGKHKLLGLTWLPKFDTLSFSLECNDSESKINKRIVLSSIAKLYDPLGLLAPLIIKCKIFMRTLWVEKLEWDQELPIELKNHWLKLLPELKSVNSISIPRWINSYTNSRIEIHGFSDASTQAIAANIYLRIVSDGVSYVNLLVSKTKVAPVKVLTVPRLELCAAHLLSKLVSNFLNEMHFPECSVHLWSDSRVALSWIKSSPHLWLQFVSHRISDIQTLCPQAIWHFIEGTSNPADLATRGLSVNELKSSQLWWQGPAFLSNNSDFTSPDLENLEILDESERRRVVHLSHLTNPQEWSLIRTYSSYMQLIRITSWCIRFINILKAKVKKSPNPYSSDVLLPSDLRNSEIFWVKHSQTTWYSTEYAMLQKDEIIERSSKILKLSPLLDKDNQCIRLGGRLKNSRLSYNAKCPFILSDKSHLSSLIAAYYHLKYLHAGTQLTLSLSREKFWIVNGRNLIKRVIRNCVKCIRFRATPLFQKMGDLPSARITESNIFTHVGVDYAGPIKMRASSGRGQISYPGYIIHHNPHKYNFIQN